MGKGVTCPTLGVWLRPSREVRHLHHSAASQPTVEPSTQDGTPWKKQSKRNRVFATGPRDGDGYHRRRGPTQPQALVRMGLERSGWGAVIMDLSRSSLYVFVTQPDLVNDALVPSFHNKKKSVTDKCSSCGYIILLYCFNN